MPPVRFTSLENYAKLFDQLEVNPGYIIVKFTADWCNPCKKSAPIVEAELEKLSENVHYYQIDIDEELELYGFLKTKKMVNGIPALLAWKKGNIDFIPDHVVLGADEHAIKSFFENILKT
jgi:thioredoxin 1